MLKNLLSSGRAWTALFFGGFLILGLSIVRDYGLYIDELTNHYFGVNWYRYVHGIVVDHAPLVPMAGLTEHDIIHGPVFESVLAFIEQAFLNLTEMREIFFFRHYAVWILFYLSVVCFYFLARRLFKNRGLALLASLFLVLQPRIFSHSFYDSVDISFLSFYIFSLFTLVRFLDRKTIGSLCLHALACALLIDVRSMGGVISVVTIALLGLDFLPPKGRAVSLRHRLLEISAFLSILIVTTVVFWPYLWTDPFARAMDVLRITPKINWGGSVLYLGRIVYCGDIPWHYIPFWILITTPVAITVFFFVGLLDSLYMAARNPAAYYRDRVAELAVGASFLLPLLMVILMKAVVYDAWRHLFFIYPPLVLIAIGGVRKTLLVIETCFKGRSAIVAKGLIAAAVAVNFANVSWFMIKNHPHENVYFNRLAGKDMKEIKSRFELDYWGLAFRRALEYVMANDRDDHVKIFGGEYLLLPFNRQILPPADARRVQEVGFDQAKYVITIYRLTREGYPTLPEYFSVKVDGASIVTVYRKEPKIN